MERSGGNPEKALRLAGVRQHADEPKRLFSFKINAKETTMNALYPSMMCVRPADVKRICTVFEKTGIAGLHIDIMDGSFVPNFTLGVDYCRYLHEITSLPLDLHLMIDRPEETRYPSTRRAPGISDAPWNASGRPADFRMLPSTPQRRFPRWRIFSRRLPVCW